jgi:hypothetical protein
MAKGQLFGGSGMSNVKDSRCRMELNVGKKGRDQEQGLWCCCALIQNSENSRKL